MTSPAHPAPAGRASEARLLRWLLGVLLVLLVVSVNRRVLGFDFLYLRDDDVNIALNPYMGALSWSRLKWMFTDTDYVRRYIPLGWLGFSTTYETARLNPYLYHFVSLVFIALNTLLVFGLSLKILSFGREQTRPSCGYRAQAFISALVAGIWALHPMRVETTAWISGNLYSQAACFLFLAWLCYLNSYPATGRNRRLWLTASWVCYVASLLTYPIGLAFPFLLAGCDLIRIPPAQGKTRGRLLAEKLWFALPLVAVLSVTLFARFANASVFGAVPTLGSFSLVQRLLQCGYIAAYYLWRPFWPFGLSPIYDNLAVVSSHDAIQLFSTLAIIIITVLAALGFKRWRLFSLLWFVYLINIIPFLGLTERPYVTSDRYEYFISAILLLIFAAWWATSQRKWAFRLAYPTSIAALFCLTALTLKQLSIWTDDVAQHKYMVAQLKDRAFRDQILGREQIVQIFRGNADQAEKVIARWLAAEPTNASFLKAGTVLAEARRLQSYYGPAPLLAVLHEQLAMDFSKKGELPEAHDHFAEALRLSGIFYQAAYNDALCLLQLGQLRQALHRYLDAQAYGGTAGGGAIGVAESRRFLTGLAANAQAAGDRDMEVAANAAIRRLPKASSSS